MFQPFYLFALLLILIPVPFPLQSFFRCSFHFYLVLFLYYGNGSSLFGYLACVSVCLSINALKQASERACVHIRRCECSPLMSIIMSHKIVRDCIKRIESPEDFEYKRMRTMNKHKKTLEISITPPHHPAFKRKLFEYQYTHKRAHICIPFIHIAVNINLNININIDTNIWFWLRSNINWEISIRGTFDDI